MNSKKSQNVVEMDQRLMPVLKVWIKGGQRLQEEGGRPAWERILEAGSKEDRR